jgi:hypothetical protein
MGTGDTAMGKTLALLAIGCAALAALVALARPAPYSGQWPPALSPACRAAFESISITADQYQAAWCDPRERKDIETFRAWHASAEGSAFDAAEQRKDMARLMSPNAPAAGQ